MAEVKTFETGATRGRDEDKLDFEGFLSPLALEAVCKYMHSHRYQVDGQLRASDNWQKGIPVVSYMKSLWRHLHEAWKAHRGYKTEESLETSLCAIVFNASGYLHELKKKERPSLFESIKHGSPEHQEWLKEAISCYEQGKPIPGVKA